MDVGRHPPAQILRHCVSVRWTPPVDEGESVFHLILFIFSFHFHISYLHLLILFHLSNPAGEQSASLILPACFLGPRVRGPLFAQIGPPRNTDHVGHYTVAIDSLPRPNRQPSVKDRANVRGISSRLQGFTECQQSNHQCTTHQAPRFHPLQPARPHGPGNCSWSHSRCCLSRGLDQSFIGNS